MQYWTPRKVKNALQLENSTVTYKKELYSNSIVTFDIETTSYKEGERLASWCYIWQVCVNGRTFYGRKLEEFLELLTILHTETKGRVIIWVHNLGFETQFLRDYLDFEIFARKPHKPIKARNDKYNIEFRCTLMLYQKSLASLSEETKVKKLVGDLDYSLIRTIDTKLTKKELAYCEHDVLVVYEKILQELETYKFPCNIPLTQTGKVRRVVKSLYDNDLNYKNKVRKWQPDTVKQFQMYCKAFQGGYTHANAMYTGELVENVASYDFTSSYPYVMVSEKFPRKFYKYPVTRFESMNPEKAYLLYVKFNNIKCVKDNVYISAGKCDALCWPIYDNGRVVSADSLTLWVTEYDVDIICQTYKFDSYTILESWTSIKAYLDIKYVNYILDLYENKTALKNVAGAEKLYVESKQYINSLYGMFATQTIRDEVTFINNEWDVHKLTPEEVQEKLNKAKTSWGTILCFQWAIYVTAIARYNLWTGGIIPHDCEVLYCDTDSVKIIGDDSYIETYNKQVIAKLRRVSNDRGIPFNRFQPADPKGERHLLGLFDYEGTYKRFITLGAKRYAYEDNEGLHVTVSGVNKERGAIALGNIENFKDGFVFLPEYTGKLTLWYLGEQEPITVTDYQGHTTTMFNRFGVYMEPTTYNLSLSPQYEDYLYTLAVKQSTTWSGHLTYSEEVDA